MRDYYNEFTRKNTSQNGYQESLPKLTKDPGGLEAPPFDTFGSDSNLITSEAPDLASPVAARREPQLAEHSRVHQVNSIDFFQGKLERVRTDPTLTAEFEAICESRRTQLIAQGSTAEDAEAYLSGLAFLSEALRGF